MERHGRLDRAALSIRTGQCGCVFLLHRSPVSEVTCWTVVLAIWSWWFVRTYFTLQGRNEGVLCVSRGGICISKS